MSLSKSVDTGRVFEIFEEICAVPRGSENTEGIALYCMSFAEKHSLRAVRDSADNVIIYKPASPGYEKAEPVILQGHLDMVCQKEAGLDIDFLKEGIKTLRDGDFITAKGTTLGADNGIAVAMILAILENEVLPHPAIEAVFTSDEEIGMIGAGKLDMGLLSAKKMINIDSETENTVTVSCAGGSDFKITVPVARCSMQGAEVTVTLKGLRGGHSGVEINSGRVNADMLAGRLLNSLKNSVDFELISIDGGDKGNAIPNGCVIKLCTDNAEGLVTAATQLFELIKTEIAGREPAFSPTVETGAYGEYQVISRDLRDKLIYILLCAPNGVQEMSAEIEGLVETSLNLGILKTGETDITLHFTLRSNKNSALEFLQEKLTAFLAYIPCKSEVFGYYPPWEYNGNSSLQRLYCDAYSDLFGKTPEIEAIHAGLECGIFSSKIKGLDCISIGPDLYDVHTTDEKLSIPSTERIFKLLLKILEEWEH